MGENFEQGQSKARRPVIKEALNESMVHKYSGKYAERWKKSNDEDYYNEEWEQNAASIFEQLIEDNFLPRKEVAILSPTANTATNEKNIEKILKKKGIGSKFFAGDIAKVSPEITDSPDQIPFARMDAYTLPFKDDQFNLILDKKGAIWQLAYKLYKSDVYNQEDGKKLLVTLLDEYFRVLKDDGLVVIDSMESLYVPGKEDQKVKRQQEDSTLTYLKWAMEKNPELKEEIGRKYSISQLGGEPYILAAIRRKVQTVH